MKRMITYAKHLAVAVCLTQLPTLLQADDARQAVDPVALENWRAIMAQNPPQEAGCFHESYPSLTRERVDCTARKRQHAGQPRVHPAHRTSTDGGPEVVGNGNDYVAYTPGGLIFWAGGSFLNASAQSVTSVGGNGGVDGPNEYSLQINTNDKMTTSACDGSTTFNCHVWQQFVYATDQDCDIWGCDAAVYMQYWLLNYGSCPSGDWNQFGDDCYVSSNAASAPDFPITDLANLSLHAGVQPGGQDCVVVYDNTGAGWGTCVPDSMLDISSVWNKTEFGIFGDGGGSQAQFSRIGGTSFTVLLQVNDGSSAAPTCLANAGTTGETNNLNLGKCEALPLGNGRYPRIRFSESN